MRSDHGNLTESKRERSEVPVGPYCCKWMEQLSDDDDAKDLASGWVKRIQGSLPTTRSDVTGSGDVKSRFGSNDEPEHMNSIFSCENGKVFNCNPRLKSRELPDCRSCANLDQFSGHSGASTHSNQYVSSFETPSKQSNVRVVIDRSSESSKLSTPRPDANFLRQKRLAFFSSVNGLQEKEDFSSFHDRNHNLSKETYWAQPLQTCKNEALDRPNVENLDQRHGVSGKPKTVNHMYQLEVLEKPRSLNDCTSNDELQYCCRTPRRFESDEDELRLELWGLKEAVRSGEVDLNAYLSECSWKNNRFIPASPHQSDDIVGECSSNTPIQTFQNEPVALRKIADKEVSNESYMPSLDQFGNEGREDDKGYSFANGKTFAREIFNGLHFNSPEPQINGPLYCGFENSDSETSLLSFGSKCDDVHYRKVQKMSPQGKSNPQEHKVKQKKGKDQILLELTEFIEGFGSSKESSQFISDTSNSQEEPLCNSRIHSGDIKLSHRQEPIIEKSLMPCKSHKSVMGKICPTCDEVNSMAANWCIECGKALISVQPTCLTAEQQNVFEKQREETQVLMAETLKTPLNFSYLMASEKAKREERLLSDEISNLSLKVSQSTTNLEDEKYLSSSHEYKRRWLRSSIAWSSYHPSELTKSPSFVKDHRKTKNRQRAISFSDVTSVSSKGKEKGGKHMQRNVRSKSARKRTVSCCLLDANKVTDNDKGFTILRSVACHQNASLKVGHKGGQVKTVGTENTSSSNENHEQTRTSITRLENSNLCKRGGKNKSRSHHHSLSKSSSSSSLEDGLKPFNLEKVIKTVPPLNLQDVGNYDRIVSLLPIRSGENKLGVGKCTVVGVWIRSQRDSEPVPFLYLPDEILLWIFSFLPRKDLVSCSQVCHQFYRISMDETLWKVIVLKKNDNITDEWLHAIGKRKPVSLTISQCHSNKVTAKGLRDLFRNCSDSLEELNFSRCRGGELIGESVLLHVAARCCWLKSVDASWSNVSDSGVQALVDNVKRLECLCLNGCQAVSDKFIKCMAKKHGKTLRIFEVFGCFNITPSGIEILGQTCKKLQTLNIGQCHKITDSAIGALVSNLPELENLDLRGCKQVRDSAVKKIVRHCPLVTTLVLANCPLITDVSLAEIATNLPRIRSLDICGCSRVSDNGICALSRSCKRLELLDLTSTGVGHKSVMSLANYCGQSLCNLKLSFCTDISDDTLIHLAKNCKRLTTLHLYGCKRVRNTLDLKLLNPALTIER